jgi:hypothetical protein
MLVPIVLAAPALVSGVSLWLGWGPEWTALSILLAAAVLALVLDFRRALRYGTFGAGAGLVTSPLLWLLGASAWYFYVTWITGAMVLPALLAPLLFAPSPHSTTPQTQRMAQVDAETLEQLAAIQRVRRE